MSEMGVKKPLASNQDGSYPRPQLVRESWADLSGYWQFAIDDKDVGLSQGWQKNWPDESRTIKVPYPMESPLSEVEETGYHKVVWYRKTVSVEEVSQAGSTKQPRLVLHFGAVDYRAKVWVNGELVGEHEGGHSPFAFDITDSALRADAEGFVLVVRVEDDPLDVAQPRGKQDWREDPHVIWYLRTTGIWQPVWLEVAPAERVSSLHWTSNISQGVVSADIILNTRPQTSLQLTMQLSHDGKELAKATFEVVDQEIHFEISLAELKNGQSEEELFWSPESPNLIDVQLQIGQDCVTSYFGIRSVAACRRQFMLNDRPYYVRGVLEQGYWHESNIAAPSVQALKEEVELIKSLGFNTARIHQKYEDPRFLYWADKLGLLVWGESPATYKYSELSVQRTTREWIDVLERDFSHPSIVTWVPLNESWGVQHISADTREQHFARGLVEITKALDPTRLVIGNDGWEQVDSDILSIHDYDDDGERVQKRYRDESSIEVMVKGIGPAGRRLVLSGDTSESPVIVTEFGGITFHPDASNGEWGYSISDSPEEFEESLRSIFTALQHSEILAGFCYTQLTDTLQEANGLLQADRTPKLPVETLRKIVLGL